MVFVKPEKWIIQSSPTTKVKKLIPKLPFEVPPKRFNIRGGPYHLRGPHTRLLSIAFSVSKLIELERIETGFYRAYETRQYTERLIMEAMRHGDCHRPTMELANFYLGRKEVIHKLFKVLVPRYLNYTESFTSMHFLSFNSKDSLGKELLKLKESVVLELKGNPLPPLKGDKIDSSNFLTNVLLKAAKANFERNN